MDKVQFRQGVFVSYSHKDKKWLEKIQTHLKPLAREEIIEIWDDTRIRPGAKWDNEIRQAILNARVVVLLVSANFLASDYIMQQELPLILKLQEEHRLSIIWIPISASMFEHTPIAKFQAASDPSKPLDTLRPSEQDQLFVKIANTLASHINTNAVANVFRIADNIYPQISATVRRDNESVQEKQHSVSVRERNGSVEFVTREAQVIQTITVADLDSLDENARQLIRAYESAMKDLLDRLTELEPKKVARDSEVRERADRESQEILNKLCQRFNKIIDFLASMGKSLHDHYLTERYLCHELSQLIQ